MEIHEKYGIGNKIAFGLGEIADAVAYQQFSLLAFVFYYSIVGIDTVSLMIGFIIWSIWNAVNDPLIGLISDRTNVKMGRRKFWISLGIVPLALIMIFLWMPPLGNKLIPENNLIHWIYFMIVIILFDFFYTMFGLNFTAAFPELYIEQSDRNQAGLIRRILTIVGLIFAFILPVAIIGDSKDINNLYNGNYFMAGLYSFMTIIICAFITVKFAIKERSTFKKDPLENPGIMDSIKITLKNRTFIFYVIANLCSWYIFGLIPTIILLWGTYVIGTSDLGSSILLLIVFLSAAGFMPIWKKVGDSKGNQKGITIGFFVWSVSFLPFLLIWEPSIQSYIISIFVMIGTGLGFSNNLYFRDLMASDVIDEDETKTGVRREGAYYGINALIIRMATILVMITIALVFSGTGWTNYNPTSNDPFQLRAGLMLLMSIPSTIACLIAGIVYNFFFPLKGEKLAKMKEELAKIHETKSSKTV